MTVISGELFTSKGIWVGSTSFGSTNPLNVFYKNSRMEIIVIPSELEALGFMAGSSITEVRLMIGTLPTQDIQNIRIALGHTTLTGFPNTTNIMPAMSTLTQCYYAALTLKSTMTANGWVPFVFQTPFIWDGTSNLLIDFTKTGNHTLNSGQLNARQDMSYKATGGWRSDSGTYPFDNAGGLSEYGSSLVPRLWVVGEDAPSSGSIVDAGTINFSGSGNIGIEARTLLAGNITFNGTSDLSFQGGIITNNTINVSAISDMLINGGDILKGDLTLGANSSIDVQASLLRNSDIDLNAGTNLSIIGSKILQGSADLQAISSFSIEYDIVSPGISLDLSGNSTFTLESTKITQIETNLTSQSNFTLNPAVIRNSLADLQANSEMLIDPIVVKASYSDFRAESTFSCIAEVIVVEVHADLVGTSNLTITGTKIINGELALSAETSMDITAVIANLEHQILMKAELQGQRILCSPIEAQKQGEATLQGSRNYSAELWGVME